MYFAIRADASSTIGMGHISRQCDLANELAKRKIQSLILIKAPPNIESFIKKRTNSTYKILPQSKTEEKIYLTNIFNQNRPQGILVDLLNDDTDKEYMKFFASLGLPVFSMTDDPNPRNVLCDIQFCCNINQKKSLYKNKIKERKLYLGLDYFILNPIFLKNRKKHRLYKKKVENILLIFGGVYNLQATQIALSGVSLLSGNVTIDCVVSSLNLKQEELKKFITNKNIKAKIHTNKSPLEICNLMNKTDIVISSAGNSAYEACVLGSPLITINQVERQNENANVIYKRSGCINLGMYDRIVPYAIASTIELLLLSKKKRESLGKHAEKIIDGKGIFRVADIIQSKII